VTSSSVLNNIFETGCDVVDVLSGKSTDRNTSILGHVDVMLADHSFGLLSGKSSEREHTNLSSNVRPVSGGVDLFNSITESRSHS